MTLVGLVTEIKPSERRCALTPAGTRELTAAGHEVLVQAGAGDGSGFTDAEYAQAGARLAPDAATVWAQADLLLKVKEPIAAEYASLNPRQTLFTYLHLAADRPLTDALIASGTTAVAYETIEDARGALPLLAPMSEIAGRLAAQAGAYFLQDPLGGRGLLIGGVPGVAPARVTVLGGGVVGTHAARIAAGMGADVTILDRSLPRLRELDELFEGRARVVMSSAAQIEEELTRSDVVIGAVLVPGAAAPKLVTRDMLHLLPPRAVLVDVAIDQGGCFETSRPTTHGEPVYEVDGILHYCVANMPGAVPRTSTRALTNATLPYVKQLADLGVDGLIARDRGVAPGVNVRGGKLVSAPVAEAFGLAVEAAIPRMTATAGPAIKDYKNLVGGQLVDGVDGATREILNPATGQVIARVPEGGAADVERAVAAARAARIPWRDTTPGERQERLLAMAAVLEAHSDELAELESLNVGKPRSLAAEELPICVDELRFFAGAARTLTGPSAGEYSPDHTSFVRREPLGIVGQIAPWNYPLMMGIWKIAPALAAGNVVVLKPSELTPVSTLRFAELLVDVLPAGVLNVVTGDGPGVGAPIVQHAEISMVSLTGSVGTGKWIARTAADTLKRVHLELGGKAPVVVFDDADPRAVAEGLRVASFLNSGQDCTAASRVLAGPRIYDALVSELSAAASSLVVGDPAEGEQVEMGPVVSARQQERVLGFLDRAQASGAEIVTGGGAGRDAGFFVQPTVVAGVEQTAEIVQNEVFGPVVTVQRVDADEAFRLANDVPYGLAASVWTRDVGLAMEAVRQLDFGCVWVNDHLPFLSEMPHGGFKESGYGKDLSIYGLEDYTRIKHAMIRLG